MPKTIYSDVKCPRQSSYVKIVIVIVTVLTLLSCWWQSSENDDKLVRISKNLRNPLETSQNRLQEVPLEPLTHSLDPDYPETYRLAELWEIFSKLRSKKGEKSARNAMGHGLLYSTLKLPNADHISMKIAQPWAPGKRSHRACSNTKGSASRQTSWARKTTPLVLTLKPQYPITAVLCKHW